MSSGYSDSDLIAHYVKLRNKIAAETEAFSERMKPYNTAMEAIANELQATLLARGADSTKTESGTAYLSTTYRCTVKDPVAFKAYVVETGDIDMFTNAVSKEAVEAFMEKNGRLPPGVDRTGFTKCNIRKS